MPVISIFLGIKITMYYDDHNPLTFTQATLDMMHLLTFVADAS